METNRPTDPRRLQGRIRRKLEQSQVCGARLYDNLQAQEHGTSQPRQEIERTVNQNLPNSRLTGKLDNKFDERSILPVVAMGRMKVNGGWPYLFCRRKKQCIYVDMVCDRHVGH